MSDETKKQPEEKTDIPLTEPELDKVSGGKVTIKEINITKQVDKSSPTIEL